MEYDKEIRTNTILLVLIAANVLIIKIIKEIIISGFGEGNKRVKNGGLAGGLSASRKKRPTLHRNVAFFSYRETGALKGREGWP